jgi:hypothetical protein
MDPPASKATAAVSEVIGLGRKLQSASKATAAVSASAARLKSMVPKSCLGSAASAFRPGPKPPSGPPPQIWRAPRARSRSRGRSGSPASRRQLKRELAADREQGERELAEDRAREHEGERALAADHAHALVIGQRMAGDHAYADVIGQRIERDAALEAAGAARYPAKAAGLAKAKRMEDRAAARALARPEFDVDEAWEDAEDEREEAQALHAEATAADAAEAARKEEDALVEECASAVISGIEESAEDNSYIYRGCGK